MAATVLVIDEDKIVRQQIAGLLQQNGYKVLVASNLDDLLAQVETNSIDALICALSLLTENPDLLNQLRRYLPYAPVIVKVKQDTGCSVVLDTLDRKSTRLNSSHVRISYAVFCLKKKKKR